MMKRPNAVPKNAKWDIDAEAWIVCSTDGEYDYETIYNDDGSVRMVIELEI